MKTTHPEIRGAVRAFDAAFARVVAHSAEAGGREESCPRDDGPAWSALMAWEAAHLDPAKATAEAAWLALGAALESAGFSAVVCGGRLYFANVGRPELATMHEDVFQHAVNVVDAARVLDLDAPPKIECESSPIGEKLRVIPEPSRN